MSTWTGATGLRDRSRRRPQSPDLRKVPFLEYQLPCFAQAFCFAASLCDLGFATFSNPPSWLAAALSLLFKSTLLAGCCLEPPEVNVRRSADPFECFNNYLCIAGVIAGGVCVLLFSALAARCLVGRLGGAAKAKGGRDQDETETEEERLEREAREAEYAAELQRLRDMYKVEPEKDPASLEEAREEYASVRQVVGGPHAGPFDKFKVDWLKAQVAYWTASEGLKNDEEEECGVVHRQWGARPGGDVPGARAR